MRKNRIRKIIALLMAVTMLLALCACGESKQQGNKAAPEVGYFVFESMEEDGESITMEDLEEYGIDADSFYLVMEADGTGYLVIPNEDAEAFTWADSKMKSGDDEIPYTIDGDTLTLEEDGIKMVFTRSSDEPPAKPSLTYRDEEEAESLETPEEVTPLDGDGMTNDSTPTASSESVSADLGDYHITILSAEQFTDSSNKDAIRFYFDFTNNSDEEESFFFACNTEAYQEGYELVSTYSYYGEVPEDGNYSLEILPGTTIRCISEYNFKPDGGEVEFTITEGYDGESVTMTFAPQALLGRPAEDYTIEPCSSDTLVENCPSEGVYDEDYYISITRSEVIDGWDDGEKAIRIYFDFTNNSEEATAFWTEATLLAMQDGIELNTTWGDESVPEEDNNTVDIQPGETITVAECFTLHDTGSPVAIKVIDYWNGNHLGTTFDVQ